jgi:hypothetical protein
MFEYMKKCSKRVVVTELAKPEDFSTLLIKSITSTLNKITLNFTKPKHLDGDTDKKYKDYLKMTATGKLERIEEDDVDDIPDPGNKYYQQVQCS